MKSVVITGTSGFLGAATLNRFSKLVKTETLSTKNRHGLISNSLESREVDTVVNFGWGGGNNNKDLNSSSQVENIKTCIELYSAAKRKGLKKFIQISSSWRYPRFGINNYGTSKRVADEILLSMGKEDGIEVSIAVPWWIYGPGDRSNRFVPSTIDKMLSGETIITHPSENKVDYLYIDDFVSAIEHIVKNEAGIYDVCSSTGISMGFLMGTIAKETGSVSRVILTDTYPNGFNMEWVGDNKKLKDIGWKDNTCIEEGIRRTVKSRN